MKKQLQYGRLLLRCLLRYLIDAAVIYLLCLVLIRNDHRVLTASMFFGAYVFFDFFHGRYVNFRHLILYYLLGRRKKEMETLKAQFRQHGVKPAVLKNSEVDDYLFSSAATEVSRDNLDARSLLNINWFKNQVLELGCPSCEAWVQRDIIRRALLPREKLANE